MRLKLWVDLLSEFRLKVRRMPKNSGKLPPVLRRHELFANTVTLCFANEDFYKFFFMINH